LNIEFPFSYSWLKTLNGSILKIKINEKKRGDGVRVTDHFEVVDIYIFTIQFLGFYLSPLVICHPITYIDTFTILNLFYIR